MEKINHQKFWVTNELLASKEKRFLNFIIDRVFLYVLLFLFGAFLFALAEVIQNDSFTGFVNGLEDINPLADMLISIILYVLY